VRARDVAAALGQEGLGNVVSIAHALRRAMLRGYAESTDVDGHGYVQQADHWMLTPKGKPATA
jgi:hypothetical protein